MKQLTLISYEYIKSKRIQVIRKKDDIQDLIDDEWILNGNNNGYFVFSKPSAVIAVLELPDSTTTTINIRENIMNYYKVKSLREKRVIEFINDLKSGYIKMYIDDANGILVC